MEIEEQIRRWRLILGKESEKRFSDMTNYSLTQEQDLMDQALASIYNRTELGGFGSQGAGRGPSNPQISRWLGDVRTLFDKELVTVIQNDAVTRCGLKQLLFEPELLENMEPDVSLASTILMLKDQIPKRSKESVREFIKKIVEEINKLLEQDIRRAVTAAVNKKKHSPIPSASAMDYKMTISRNLKHYNPDLKTIVPEHFYFFDRTSTTAANKWTIILDIDQSGSMGESVIYSSIISCILASMASVKTRIVAFDTNIVDLTEKSDDPVDLLFGFQLGGGTDINKSVAYCEQFIENPSKTLFFLISDLEEGGNRAALLRRMEEMKASGVTVVSLLALADGGKPYYDTQMAQKLAGLGIPCFACSPQLLPELLEKALKGQDLSDFDKNKKK
ncbi:MAG: VWA domain-containing protein [Lachnospiraceae bacterium]|nr:VWA domain-containing protein [Lachnospiraceae bacterium]MBO5144411.1 VWA domain-containing protein [Lachnospiraceae bacterium]